MKAIEKEKYLQFTEQPKDYLLPSRHQELRKDVRVSIEGPPKPRTQAANHQIIPNVNDDQRNANQKCDFYLLHWRDKDPSLGSTSLRPFPDPPAANQLEHCRRGVLFGTREVKFGTHRLDGSEGAP